MCFLEILSFLYKLMGTDVHDRSVKVATESARVLKSFLFHAVNGEESEQTESASIGSLSSETSLNMIFKSIKHRNTICLDQVFVNKTLVKG